MDGSINATSVVLAGLGGVSMVSTLLGIMPLLMIVICASIVMPSIYRAVVGKHVDLSKAVSSIVATVLCCYVGIMVFSSINDTSGTIEQTSTIEQQEQDTSCVAGLRAEGYVSMEADYDYKEIDSICYVRDGNSWYSPKTGKYLE